MIDSNLKNKKLFLLDMDGTIYLDNILFDYSLEFLNSISSNGGKYIFLTNNSSKSVSEYIDKLIKLGIKVDKTNFMTSSQATAIHLKKFHGKQKIYVLGTKSLKKELVLEGLQITDKFEKDIDCVVVGFDTELNYKKLEDVCQILSTQQVAYLATNVDLVCPTSFGFIPDCGSICQMIETATGKKPRYIGKPEATMVELAIESTEFTKLETIIIGDRLYTDIACGINAEIDTAVVLTGETKIMDIANSEFKPIYIFEDIGELYKKILKT